MMFRATLNANRGLSRSIQSLKVSQASEGCKVRCARAHWVIPDGAITSSRASPIRARSLSTIGCRAAPTSGSAKAKASTAIIRRPAGFWDCLVEHDTRYPREGGDLAGEPAGRVGARRLLHHARDVEPTMRRPYPIETAEARRHPHRAAGVGAKCGVAEPGGDRCGRARGGAARHPVGRPGVDRGTVERVFPDNPERNLVGNRFADQRRTGIEQTLHGPSMACRNRVRPRPIGIAAAGRVPRDVEQIFAAKVKPVSGPPGRPSMCTRGPGTKALISSGMKASGCSNSCDAVPKGGRPAGKCTQCFGHRCRDAEA